LCQLKKGEQINGLKLSSGGDFYVMNGGIEPSGYYSKYNSEGNTISISEGGNSCGYVQYNSSRFWSGGHCYTLNNINKKILTKYLYYYLKNQEKNIMELRVGSGLPNIQKKELDRFQVKYPSLEKQQEIVRILDSLSDKIETERAIHTAYQTQKKYLLSNMFI
jgi:type I restriction enzyme S subunit